MSNLKQKIREYIARENTPIYLIEKKLNLANSVISRILDGSVKYPTVENLIKIADALDCSVDELLGRKQSPLGYRIPNYQQIFTTDLTKEELDIFNEVTNNVITTIKTKKIVISFDKLDDILKEVFEYSIKSTPYFIDERFINWVLRRY